MNILLCVAGMPYAEQTVQFGYLIARLFKASVTLFTVVADESALSEAQTVLTALSKQTDVQVVDKIVRLGGTAVSEIVSECQAGDYGMVVLGTRLISGLLPFKRSGVAATITKEVPIPVLVVKQSPEKLQRLLICMSGQDQEPVLVQKVLELALPARAAVRLLYVADPVPHMYSGLEQMDETADELLQSGTPIAEQLQQALTLLHDASVDAQLVVRHGLVADEILTEIEESAYDLVIIGASEHEAFWQALVMGRISPFVVENASCSVMVVHHT
ncbi:universal stress protein [Candidatus Leptofilum sp.]|uniref:universal stress protein n=1 Tax=Candidatus Leptofilum sp. TaxID=3241576 RepID=UPI003B59CEAD